MIFCPFVLILVNHQKIHVNPNKLKLYTPFHRVVTVQAISWLEKGLLLRFPPIWCIFAAPPYVKIQKIVAVRFLLLGTFLVLFPNFKSNTSETCTKVSNNKKQNDFYLISRIVGLSTLKMQMIKLFKLWVWACIRYPGHQLVYRVNCC